MYSKGDVLMQGGSFLHYNSSGYGGAVYAEGDITMKDSSATETITAMAVLSRLWVNQLIIHHTPALSSRMSGGQIDENFSNFGGGVYLKTNGGAKLSGGVISKNDAIYDGGSIHADGIRNLSVESGALIELNEAGRHGGGIYIMNPTEFHYDPNSVRNNTPENIYSNGIVLLALPLDPDTFATLMAQDGSGLPEALGAEALEGGEPVYLMMLVNLPEDEAPVEGTKEGETAQDVVEETGAEETLEEGVEEPEAETPAEEPEAEETAEEAVEEIPETEAPAEEPEAEETAEEAEEETPEAEAPEEEPEAEESLDEISEEPEVDDEEEEPDAAQNQSAPEGLVPEEVAALEDEDVPAAGSQQETPEDQEPDAAAEAPAEDAAP